ncbi:cyclohexyl-isocyanide hydratase [Anaerobacterium chartisolvens]|uniref:Cyclohexyl-isocyanide hydratase n=1 Tax=Anaerobacterium chartisolvens TaxID=1297424 RepID=A0A369AYH7_9FIRM|nr:DJ-1/PfpI family protein [Anaerobacterium chartisolvens]RCX12504.1 cyclohexyl-isocyanide hydratase [Anaerobacterium chartisolvens]
MKATFIIYNGMTALDFVGIYDPITRLNTMGFLPDFVWEISAYTEEVCDNTGLYFRPSKVRENLAHYDMLVVPGGFGSRELIDDADFINWLKTAKNCSLKVSVCTGALLLGAAGFLKGKNATTHPNAYGKLKKYCKTVSRSRIVEDNGIITGGGVTAAIELGLYLCEKLADYDTRIKIQKQMDYQLNPSD